MFNRNLFNKKTHADKERVDVVQSEEKEESLNSDIPIETLYKYLLRDYRLEQQKVKGLCEDLRQVKQEKNALLREVKQLREKDMDYAAHLQDMEALKNENRKLRDTLVRVRNILTMGKVSDLLEGKKD